MSAYQPHPSQPPYPPYGYAPPRAEPKNGLGIAALICGGCGVLLGLFPIGFWIAGPLAFATIVLAGVNFGRLRRNTATNPLVTVIGLFCGIAAAFLAISGARVMSDAVDRLNDSVTPTKSRAQLVGECLARHRHNPDRVKICVN